MAKASPYFSLAKVQKHGASATIKFVRLEHPLLVSTAPLSPKGHRYVPYNPLIKHILCALTIKAPMFD